jgi:hypothetical protein
VEVTVLALQVCKLKGVSLGHWAQPSNLSSSLQSTGALLSDCDTRNCTVVSAGDKRELLFLNKELAGHTVHLPAKVCA